MPISRDEILKVAALARINLNPEELELMASDLARIMAYVDQIKGVETAGIIPRTEYLQTENVFREDVVKSSLPAEKALGNAPDQDGEYFRVPRVL